jgi:DegV family protein with EDD domain
MPDGTSFMDDESFSDYDGFFRFVRDSDDLPTTVQIPPVRIARAFENMLGRYDRVVYLAMSSAMSGTYNNAVTVAADFGGRVKVLDSKQISLGYGALALLFQERLNGADFDRVEDILEDIQSRFHFYFIIPDLKHLLRGGRVGRASYVAAKILKIMPILWVADDGVIDVAAKVRGTRKAVSWFKSALEKWKPDGRLFFSYPLETQLSRAVRKEIVDTYPHLYWPPRPTTVIHGGPFSVGIAWTGGGEV